MSSLTGCLLATVVLASCSDPTSILEACGDSTLVRNGLTCEPSPTSDYAIARARWTATRPPSYEYTLMLSCFCGPDVRRPVRIIVDGTTVTSRSYADDGAPFPALFAPSFPSIDGLFDMIADAKRQNAARADASYDAATGRPLQISFDYRTTVADDESFYVASGFRAR